MKEIEVKILEVNVKATISKLKKLGAKKIYEGKMDIRYFDTTDRFLKSNGKMVRLRGKGKTVELTVKKKMNQESVKSNQEYEVLVSDFEKMHQILKELGFNELTNENTTKKRVSYAVGNVHFEFDTFQGIPTFLEIEATNKTTLQKWVKKLGYSWKDVKPWAGKDVLAHYGKITQKVARTL